MPNPFSWDYLTHRPTEDEVWGPFGIAYLVVFIVGFFVAVFLYNDGARFLTPHPVTRRYLRKLGAWTLLPLTFGLFFFVIRVLQIDPFTFGRRIWLYLSVLALLAVLGYFTYFVRTHYQRDIEAYERDRTKRTYLIPKHATSRARRRRAS